MKKKISVLNKNSNQTKLYFILIGLALLSFILGILFIFIIDKNSLSYIKDHLSLYFDNIPLNINTFFKTLFNNFIYIIIIWVLGISLIGLPIVILMFAFKSFIFGFSISSIMYSFGFKGILISLINVIINKFAYIVVLLLITRYSISFSIKLFKHLFLRKPINFRETMNKYLKVLIISLVISLFISIYESFISNYLLNFFNL